MTSLIGIRRRIRSTKNISQITKAMQMVSASKMRKAQDAALATRPFTEKLRSILGRVASAGSAGAVHELTEVRAEKKILMILISTTKGLCGGLNVNLHRGFMNFALENKTANIEVATVGRKARWVIPGRDTDLVARFDNLKETPSFEETRAITSYAIEKFIDHTYDAVYMVYPKFITTLTNQVTVEKLLPVSPASAETTAKIEYKIEPDPDTLMQKLIPYEVEMSMYQSLLESRATEHSARMVAMKNASENAKDLISSLTLDYNSARQSQVTSELLDVTTARMAIE